MAKYNQRRFPPLAARAVDSSPTQVDMFAWGLFWRKILYYRANQFWRSAMPKVGGKHYAYNTKGMKAAKKAAKKSGKKITYKKKGKK